MRNGLIGMQGSLKLQASTQSGPQLPAPLDPQCLRGWRSTEAELAAPAVGMQLGLLGRLEMAFTSAPAQGTLCLPFFLLPKNTY